MCESTAGSLQGPAQGKRRQGSLTLLQLTELMKEEAQATSLTAAEQPLPAKGPLSDCAATPPEDSSGAGQPVWEQPQPYAGLPDCGPCSGGADTPTLAGADGPRRCSTLDSLQSFQTVGIATPLGKSVSLPPALETSPVIRPQLLRPSSSFGGQLGLRSGLRSRSVSANELQRLALAGSKPVREVGPELSEQLSKTCFKALRFLASLQRPGYCRVTSGPMGPLMPKTVLRFSKGLAFLWERKVGLGLGYTWGGGFVIAQLPGWGWSAPSFFTSRCTSLGLSLGYQHAKFCYAIATREALDAFKEDSAGIDFDSVMPLESDPLDTRTRPVKAVTAPPLTHRPSVEGSQSRTYLSATGFMVNLSLRCGVTCVDEGMNGALYGPGITASDILEGGVQPPNEFKPLYDVIGKLAAQAPVVKASKSQFHMYKQQTEKRLAKLSRDSTLPRPRSLAGSQSGGGPPTNDHTAGTSTWGGLFRGSTVSEETLCSLAQPSNSTHSPTEGHPAGGAGAAGEGQAAGPGAVQGEGGCQPQACGSSWLLFGDVELPPKAFEDEAEAGCREGDGGGAEDGGGVDQGQGEGSQAWQQQGGQEGNNSPAEQQRTEGSQAGLQQGEGSQAGQQHTESSQAGLQQGEGSPAEQQEEQQQGERGGEGPLA